MAGETKIEIDFDHYVDGEERCNILTEGVKHLIFHRRQIPLPFVILDQEAKRIEAQEDPSQVKTNRSKPRPISQSVKLRKRRLAIDAIKSVITGLEQFHERTSIYSIALVFGSTIVSPKEIFIIIPSFVKPCIDEITDENVSYGMLKRRNDKSARNMVRRLVTDPSLSSMNDIRPTNTFVFLLAPRLIGDKLSDLFHPKQSYRMPGKGRNYKIFLTNKTDDLIDDAKSDYHSIDLDEVLAAKDLIWYQAKETIRGF